MGMKLKHIELHNIRSHEYYPLDFHEDGITAISGPNGSGKSTIVDSVAWILYGVKPKGVRKNTDIVRYGADFPNVKAYASLILTIDSIDMKVERKIVDKKGAIECNVWEQPSDSNEDFPQSTHKAGPASSHAQNYIIRRLNMDQKGFLASILVQQKQVDQLISATAAERAEVIEKLTGISSITAGLKEARSNSSSLKEMLKASPMVEGELEKLEEELKTINIKIGSLNDDLKENQIKRQELDVVYHDVQHKVEEYETRENDIRELNDKKIRLEAESEALQLQYDELKILRDDKKREVDNLGPHIDVQSLSDELNENRNNLDTKRNSLTTLKNQKEYLKEENTRNFSLAKEYAASHNSNEDFSNLKESEYEVLENSNKNNIEYYKEIKQELQDLKESKNSVEELYNTKKNIIQDYDNAFPKIQAIQNEIIKNNENIKSYSSEMKDLLAKYDVNKSTIEEYGDLIDLNLISQQIKNYRHELDAAQKEKTVNEQLIENLKKSVNDIQINESSQIGELSDKCDHDVDVKNKELEDLKAKLDHEVKEKQDSLDAALIELNENIKSYSHEIEELEEVLSSRLSAYEDELSALKKQYDLDVKDKEDRLIALEETLKLELEKLNLSKEEYKNNLIIINNSLTLENNQLREDELNFKRELKTLPKENYDEIEKNLHKEKNKYNSIIKNKSPLIEEKINYSSKINSINNAIKLIKESNEHSCPTCMQSVHNPNEAIKILQEKLKDDNHHLQEITKKIDQIIVAENDSDALISKLEENLLHINKKQEIKLNLQRCLEKIKDKENEIQKNNNDYENNINNINNTIKLLNTNFIKEESLIKGIIKDLESRYEKEVEYNKNLLNTFNKENEQNINNIKNKIIEEENTYHDKKTNTESLINQISRNHNKEIELINNSINIIKNNAKNSIINLQESNKKKIISYNEEIKNINVLIIELSEKINDFDILISKEEAKLQSEITRHNTLESLKDRREELDKSIKSLEVIIKESQDKSKSLEDDLSSYDTYVSMNIQDMRQELENLNDQLKTLQKEFDEKAEIYQTVKNNLRLFKQTISNIKNNEERLISIEKSMKNMEAEIVTINNEVILMDKLYKDALKNESVRNEYKEIRTRIVNISDKIEVSHGKLNALNETIQEIGPLQKVNIDGLRSKLNKARDKREELLQTYYTIDKELTENNTRKTYLDSSIERSRNEAEKHKSLLTAVEIAETSVKNLEEFRHDRIDKSVPRVSAYASELLSRFTNGKFIQLTLDKKFNATVTLANGSTRAVGLLSGGELSAAAISLRLAIALMLGSTSEEGNLLILDEVLVSMDDERAELILNAIKEVFHGQLIIISHGPNTNEIADYVEKL